MIQLETVTKLSLTCEEVHADVHADGDYSRGDARVTQLECADDIRRQSGIHVEPTRRCEGLADDFPSLISGGVDELNDRMAAGLGGIEHLFGNRELNGRRSLERFHCEHR